MLCRALAVLKDLIGEHKNLVEPTFFPISRFELSFYRNQVRRALDLIFSTFANEEE